jgi:hypothetical protein
VLFLETPHPLSDDWWVAPDFAFSIRNKLNRMTENITIDPSDLEFCDWDDAFSRARR